MIAVISDVHGCVNTLQSIHSEIISQYENIADKIYCVGDLVDRGNYSADVIEFCIEKKINCCIGNHDFMFLSYFREPDSYAARLWQYNGHIPTLKSYNKFQMELDKHLNFVSSCKLFYNTEDCFVSHAGISTRYKKYFKEFKLDGSYDAMIDNLLRNDLDEDYSIIWEREPLLNIDKLQVIGHTRMFEIKFDKNSNTYYIDTGCVYGNKLTAAIVENNQMINKIEKTVVPEDVINSNYQ